MKSRALAFGAGFLLAAVGCGEERARPGPSIAAGVGGVAGAAPAAGMAAPVPAAGEGGTSGDLAPAEFFNGIWASQTKNW